MFPSSSTILMLLAFFSHGVDFFFLPTLLELREYTGQIYHLAESLVDRSQVAGVEKDCPLPETSGTATS